ncbi:hypothetical protein KQI84_02240 [bacterium]|nr:hypothetical protein [bacterium]
MTYLEGEKGNAPEQDRRTAEIEERQRRRNRIFLIGLVVLVLVLAISSYWLMNNYYDPYLASRSRVH